MRILGFSRRDWIDYETGHPKLEEDKFTTFRFKRRDRDYEVGEVVQVVIRPRTPGREILGSAMIINKEERRSSLLRPVLLPEGTPLAITEDEARRDGFPTYHEMRGWLYKTHGKRLYQEPMNKLTLVWC